MSEEDKYFPSRFLKAADFEKPINVTITKGSDEKVGDPGKEELKPKVSFEELDKELILNKTNYSMIRELVAEEQNLVEEKVTMSDWPGTVIQLYASEALFKGKTVPAIRIRKSTSKPVKESKQSQIEEAMTSGAG